MAMNGLNLFLDLAIKYLEFIIGINFPAIYQQQLVIYTRYLFIQLIIHFKIKLQWVFLLEFCYLSDEKLKCKTLIDITEIVNPANSSQYFEKFFDIEPTLFGIIMVGLQNYTQVYCGYSYAFVSVANSVYYQPQFGEIYAISGSNNARTTYGQVYTFVSYDNGYGKLLVRAKHFNWLTSTTFKPCFKIVGF